MELEPFANIFQQFYMVVYTMIVGQFLGMQALASIGAADWTNWLFLCCGRSDPRYGRGACGIADPVAAENARRHICRLPDVSADHGRQDFRYPVLQPGSISFDGIGGWAFPVGRRGLCAPYACIL